MALLRRRQRRSCRSRCRAPRPPAASLAGRDAAGRGRGGAVAAAAAVRRDGAVCPGAGAWRCRVGAGARASVGARCPSAGGASVVVGRDGRARGVRRGRASVTAESPLGWCRSPASRDGHDRLVGVDDLGEDLGGEGPAVDRARRRTRSPSAVTESGKPTQTQVVILGVAPQNQASPLSSVVPVLPQVGSPVWARWPVPDETTVERIDLASVATPGSITCLATSLLTPLAPVSSGTGAPPW